MIGWWFYSGLFSTLYPLNLGVLVRDQFYAADVLNYKKLLLSDLNVMVPFLYISLLMVFICLSKFSSFAKRWPLVIVFSVLLFLHALIVSVFRGDQQGGFAVVLFKCLYNQYFFWLFAFLLIFFLVDWCVISMNGYIRIVRRMFIVVSAIFIFLSGIRLFETNKKIAVLSRPSLQLVERIEKEKVLMGGEFKLDVNQDVLGNKLVYFKPVYAGSELESRYKMVGTTKSVLAMLYPRFDEAGDLSCSNDGRSFKSCLNDHP